MICWDWWQLAIALAAAALVAGWAGYCRGAVDARESDEAAWARAVLDEIRRSVRDGA